MFTVKIANKKEKRNQVFEKTIGSVINYILNSLNFPNSKILSDSNCVEIIAGKQLPTATSDEIVVELLIKKHIIIRSDELNDRAKLDQHLSNIKQFCEQAKIIEEHQYLPINMRN